MATQDPCSLDKLSPTTMSDHSTVTTETISPKRLSSLSAYPNREQLLMLHPTLGRSADSGGLWVSQF